MKKLLAAAIAGTMMLAGGCMKVDNTLPDHIDYAGFPFYTPNTSFITDIAGDRSVKIAGGWTREAYENPENIYAWFIELTVYLGQPEHSEWEGEYPLSAPFMGSVGLFEFKERLTDENGSPIDPNELTVPLTSGTLTIEHIEGDKYKVTFNGYGMTDEGDTPAISAETANTVKMVVP